MSRWDYLFDAKLQELPDFVASAVAKIVAKELECWPPRVEAWESEVDRLRFAPLFEPSAPLPTEEVLRESFRLARWEISRDIEAIDEYMRNERWRESSLDARGHLQLLFISRWLVEQMLGLLEATEGRLRRELLVQCLARAEGHLALLRQCKEARGG